MNQQQDMYRAFLAAVAGVQEASIRFQLWKKIVPDVKGEQNARLLIK